MNIIIERTNQYEFGKQLYLALMLILILAFFCYSFPFFILGILGGTKIASIVTIGYLLLFVSFIILLTRQDPLTSIKFLFVIVLFQPCLTMLAPTYLGSSFVKIQVAMKDMYAVILVLTLGFYVLQNFKLFLIDKLYIFFLGYGFLSIFTGSSPSLFVSIASFRELLMIYVFFMLGRLMYYYGIDILQMIYFAVVLSGMEVLFGLIEYNYPQYFWNKIFHIIDYTKVKTGTFPKLEPLSGLPTNYFTYKDGERVRRLVAFNGEATSLSRFLGTIIATLMTLGERNKKTILIIGFLLLGLLFTNARGGLLFPIVIVLLFFLRLVKGLAIPIIIPLMYFMLFHSSSFNVSSANNQRHLHGLTKGIANAFKYPTGRGLGATGQMAATYTGDVRHADEDFVSESFVGCIGAQLGLVGLAAFLLFVIIVITQLCLFLFSSQYELNYLVLTSCALFTTVMLTSLFSNSAVSAISAFVTFILTGYTYQFIQVTKEGVSIQ